MQAMSTSVREHDFPGEQRWQSVAQYKAIASQSKHDPDWYHNIFTTHGIQKMLSTIWSDDAIYNDCLVSILEGTRAPSQYPKRRLFVRSREVSKPRDWYFKLSYRFEIWQAHRQQCCRSACQISERSDNSKYKSRGFEALRDLTKRRLLGYWDGALGPTRVQHQLVRTFHYCIKLCILQRYVIVIWARATQWNNH